MTSYKLWKRRLHVEINGRTIPSDLTVEFKINFSEKPDVDTGDIKIYNLSKQTVRSIKEGSVIRVSAGYMTTYGNIFYGQVLSATTSWSGPDKITEITLGDVNQDYRKMRYSKSFAPGITNDEVIAHLITRSGLGIGDLDTVKNPVYKNGLQVNGRIYDSIQKYARVSGSKFYINNMRAYVRPRNKSNGVGFLLNKDTGLVDIPEPIETEIDEVVYNGYKIKSLLNHNIGVDNVVRIESKTANGEFRVSSGAHEGGNNENSYYTTMEVYPV